MAQTIKLKRSATSGAAPSTSALELGEVAINTYDGKMYIKKNDGSDSVVEVSGDKLPLAGGTMTGNLILSHASSPTLTLQDTTNTVKLLHYAQDANAASGTYSAHPYLFYTNSTLALTLDTSQNATFAGTISSGAITTSGTLDFTANPAYIQNDQDNSGQIIVSAKNSSGSAQQVRWDAANASTGAWRPGVTDSSNLGLTNRVWNTLYVNNIRMGSSNTLFVDASRNITAGNITTTGYLRGPSTFTIDPAAHGDDTGTVVIAGNLQVDGTTTTINSTTLTVDDKNITLASGSTNAAAANGAGITVECGSDTDATFTYDGTNDEWDFNKNVKVSGSVGVTNIVTNKVVKFNGTILDDSTITDTGSLITLGTSTDVSGPLQFTSNVSFSSSEPGRIYKASNHGLAFQGVTGTENDFAMFTPAGQLMVVNPTGTNNVALIPTAAGNVGIGTPNPYYKLDTRFSSATTSLSDGSSGNWGGNGIRVENTSGTAGTMALAHFRVGDADWHVGAKRVGTNQADFIFAHEGSTKVAIDRTGNVGIGTTSPDTKLDIDGLTNGGIAFTATQVEIDGQSVLPNGRIFYNDSRLIYDSPANGHRFAVAGNQGSNIAMVIDSSKRVGIGTTSPSRKLDISAPANDGIRIASDNALIGGGASGGDTQLIYWNGSNAYYGRSSLGGSVSQHEFRTAGTTRLTIDSSGNVGIGTTSPDTTLHVFTSGPTQAKFVRDLSTDVGLTLGNDNSGAVLGTLGVHNFQFYANSARRLNISGTGAITFNEAFTFPTSDGSGNQVLQTDGSGNVSWASIAGVGTATEIADADGDTRIQVEESADEDKIRFDTAGTERMVIDDTGKVGINSASLTKTLNVGGTFLATGEAFFSHFDNTTSSSRIRDNLRLNFGTARTFAITGNSTNMHVKNGTADVMTFDTSNRVGIGTTSPATKLQIVGSTNSVASSGGTLGIRQKGDTHTDGIALTSSHANSGRIFKDASGHLHIYNTGGGINDFVIQNTGNVGIGTNSPSQKLQVAGIILADTALAASTGTTSVGIGAESSINDSSSTYKTKLITESNNAKLTTYSYSSYLTLKAGVEAPNYSNNWSKIELRDGGGPSGTTAHMKFYTSGSQRMTIDDGGNVGIGTTSPGAKLHVLQGGETYDDGIKLVGTSGPISGRLYMSGEHLRIDNATSGSGSGLTLDDTGKLGINEINPSYKLEVAGDGHLIRATGTTAGGSAKIGVYNESDGNGNAGTLVYLESSGWGEGFLHVGSHKISAQSGDFNIRAGSGLDLTFGNGTAEYARISGAGNVGIRTNNPQANISLDVRSVYTAGSTAIAAYGYNATGKAILANGYATSGTGTNTGIIGISTGPRSSVSGSVNVGGHFFAHGAETNYALTTGTGNVGIATSTPQSKLDVKLGNNETASIGGTISVGAYAGLRFGYSEVGNTNYRHAAIVFERDDASFGDARGNIHILNSPSGSTSSDLGDSRLTILPSGNIGIGTTSPAYKLNVLHSSNATNGITVENATTGTSARSNVRLLSDAGQLDIYTTSSTYNGVSSWTDSGVLSTSSTTSGGLVLNAQSGGIKFQDATTEIMRISDGGNVGIGTTSPATKLMLEHNNDGAAGGTIRIKDRDSQQAADQLTGAIEFESEDATTPTSGVSTAIKAFAASSSGGSYLTISTTDIGTSTLDERMRIDSSGNVGIGTDNPTSYSFNTGIETVIKGTTNSQLSLISDTTGVGYLAFGDGTTGTDRYSGLLEYYHSDDSLRVRTSGTERMRIDSSGNVGIGTSSIIGNLNLHGGTGDTASQDAVQAFTRVSSTGNRLAAKIKLDNYDTNHADLKFQVKTTASSAENNSYYTDALTIQGTSGNVGIGNTSPTSYGTTYRVLHIGDAGTAGLLKLGTGASTNGPEMYSPANGKLYINTDSNTNVINLVGSNVGIGTTTPTNTDYGSVVPKLHVRQSSTTGAFNLVARFEAGSDAEATGGAILINHSNDRGILIEGGRDGSGTAADDDAVGHLGVVTSSGSHTRMVTLRQNMVGASSVYNVGIGTTSPQAKLQVEALGIDTTATTTSATTQVAIDTMAAATFRSAKYTIQVTNTTDSSYHVTEILLIHDGTTPGITEYGTVFTGSAAEATFDADISSGNVRLLATPASTDSMTFKVVRHCITV